MLAELAKGKLRQKLPALREALAGRFRTHHALIVVAGADAGPGGEVAVGRGRRSSSSAASPTPKSANFYFQQRDQEQVERYRRRLIRQLERLGHKVTLEPLPEAA